MLNENSSNEQIPIELMISSQCESSTKPQPMDGTIQNSLLLKLRAVQIHG